jgi:hypothetical protein
MSNMSGIYPSQYPQPFGQRDQQPYAYGVNPMQPSDLNIQAPQMLPSLTSSLMSPQLNNSYQNNYVEPTYAKGGHASLSHLAERLRMQGTDGDTILAHINPFEAMQLAQQSGGESINPHTGLPSYKFKPWKILKPIAQIGAPILGGILGGPAGAAIGGGLAGLIGGGKNPIQNALMGAGLGYVGGGGFGSLGGLGQVLPGKGQGLGSMFGGGAGRMFNGGFTGAGEAAGAGGMFGGANGLSNALMLAGLAAPLLGKKQVPKEQSLTDYVKDNPIPWREDQKYVPQKPLERVLEELEEEDFNQSGAPEIKFFKPRTHLAHGGHLNGYDGGQEDTIDAKLSDGEFVLPADVVSSLGDGNNNAGAKKLDNFMVNVRKHKLKNGAKKLPPKAKSLSSYMMARGGR